MAENWLVSEIVSGLQKLLALRLAGTPPEDSIKATGIVWIEALDDCGIKWVEHLDRERVQRAFKTMYRTCGQLKAGGEITIPEVGKLSVGNRAARNGRNPKTGESIQIPAKKVPAFSAAKALKDAVSA